MVVQRYAMFYGYNRTLWYQKLTRDRFALGKKKITVLTLNTFSVYKVVCLRNHRKTANPAMVLKKLPIHQTLVLKLIHYEIIYDDYSVISPLAFTFTGLAVAPDWEPTPSILSTTSNPSITLPNTVCFPSNHGVSTVQIKNCDPFVPC